MPRNPSSYFLDAKCILGDGRVINIEIQNPFSDNHQRVRYNGCVLTANIVDPGDKFKAVPDICMVYIANLDIFVISMFII